MKGSTMQLSTFVRAFSTTLEQTGTHQLTGRLVPYNVATDVLDRLPAGGVDIYREGFKRGAFSTQAASMEPGVIRRIGLVHTHEGGLGFLGPFVALRELPDGLYGDVSILRSKATDVEDLLAAGVNELSVEFRLPGASSTQVDADGVRWRNRAHLDRVALEAKGAYTGAQVLAYRSEHAAELAEAEAEQAAAAAAAAAEQAANEELAADLERQTAEAEERKRKWDELCARAPEVHAKQQAYIRSLGLTVRPNDGLPQKG